MKKITVGAMMKQKPCKVYNRGRVEELWSSRKTVTVLDILEMDIPAEDRIWAATRNGFVDEDVIRRWLEMTVTRAVTNHVIGCGVLEAEEWGRKWLTGEDRTAEAATAAWAAAKAAAWAAAKAAAWVATAAWAAAKAAAWAAEAGAKNNEYELQVSDLKKLLKGDEK